MLNSRVLVDAEYIALFSIQRNCQLAVDARRPSDCSFYTVPERGDQQEVIMKLEFECEATLNFTLRHVFHTIPKFLNFSLSVK